ncbi:retropepsin-like aspartic protease family protein [Aliiroseovarius lamellibrachiae]|uniref:retropepsin-like aspartic protease family protein n=1 Tax=Aliiroseovarius lamellibrachiae TaxID=1924933 RepID=UPI001BE0AEF7|nr:TIGR02281 family clan AA aspartic protease [Aliiroseovarius lamellibrachiae]MBT2131046.1 TIGR02281 family clan AA aspartic protease [Aliiroseovarius lamellibrachiae]
MTSDMIGQMAYLALLLVAVAGYFISENRFSLGQTLRHALIWIFIFVGALAVVGLWQNVKNDISPRQTYMSETGQITLPRAYDGHFYAQLMLNGKPVDFVIDTGASNVVLTKKDAERAGIDLSALRFFGRAMTANGQTRTAPARIARVEIEDIMDFNLEVWVNEGEMSQSLLGNTYLQRFTKIEIGQKEMILTR